MAEWLYSIVQTNQRDRRPDFARTSALNWMAAVSLEVWETHGRTVAEQLRSCRKRFASINARSSAPERALVFEPLYASVTFATSLLTRANQPEVGAWQAPGAVIEWYYAVYHACRAMLAAYDTPPADKHVKVAEALNSKLRRLLPHPLDMYVTWAGREDFSPHLPSIVAPAAPWRGNALVESFNHSRPQAQAMLQSYLRGTGTYYYDRIKDEMRRRELKHLGVTDFRSAKAKAARDARMTGKEFNVLHLAFRYRGKANYRDALFLAYGAQHLRDATPFVRDLANVARFAALCALTLAERRLPTDAKLFDADLRANFAGTGVFYA